MNLTYRQLGAAINSMSDEEKDCNVTVYVEGFDEFYPIEDIRPSDDNDVIDEGCPILYTPED